ncbi:MAG: toll/interleukin-1 receptor domain-containing protein [Ktedonobacterales bacterium]|nr:toll/interleukin-1 receptor domain-containing protein [Ktedonobacterales bacterium]
MEPEKTLFVSHAEAAIPLVSRYVAALRRTFSVWYDQDSLPVGASLFEAITTALTQNNTLIAFLSPAALESVPVMREIQEFLHLAEKDQSRVFLPVILQPCNPPPWISIVFYLNLTTMTVERGIEALTAAVQGQVGYARQLRDARIQGSIVLTPADALHQLRLNRYVNQVGWTGDGAYVLAVVDGENACHVWNINTNQEEDPFTLAGDILITSFALIERAPHLVALVGGEGNVVVWDIPHRHQVAGHAYPETVRSASFSPDGRYLVMGGAYGRIVQVAQNFKSAASGYYGHTQPGASTPPAHATKQKRDGASTQVDVVAWSPDGSRIASVGTEQTAKPQLHVWNAFDRTTIVGRQLPWRHSYSPKMLLWSPGSYLIAMSARFGETINAYHGVEIMQASTLRPQYRMPPQLIEARYSDDCAMAWSPKGDLLAVGGTGGAHIWEIQTGRITRSFVVDDSRYSGNPNYVRYPDDAPLFRGFPYPNRVESLAFAPDGKRLAAGTSHGPLYIWPTEDVHD